MEEGRTSSTANCINNDIETTLMQTIESRQWLIHHHVGRSRSSTVRLATGDGRGALSDHPEVSS
jgi:hypothetical protein